MNKFEFGDRVHNKLYGEGVVIRLSSQEKCALVRFEFNEHWFEFKDLTVIPHPDTERLEWLYKNGLSKISKEIVFGKGRQIETINDLREVIDDERYRRENPDPSGIVEENAND